MAFDYKHPLTVIAANFSTAVKTEERLQAEASVSTTKVTKKRIKKRVVTATKTKATTSTKKKRRCKMVDLGGTMVEKCFNF